MAGCDYYSCDICGSKTFYDAELYYSDIDGKLPGVGDMNVICRKCAETNEIVIRKKNND